MAVISFYVYVLMVASLPHILIFLSMVDTPINSPHRLRDDMNVVISFITLKPDDLLVPPREYE